MGWNLASVFRGRGGEAVHAVEETCASSPAAPAAALKCAHMEARPRLIRSILDTAARAQEGHVPSALSVLDIVWTLHDVVMNPDDRFIFSKGHGCLALYAVLAEKGTISAVDLASFGNRDSILGGHPDSRKVPGVYASSGSLGHGLPIAVGAAMAKPGRVFCLVGDQECNEGSVWEAALVAAHHRLGNLCVIVDFNKSGEDICRVDPLDYKFAAFGWEAVSVDGHDSEALARALSFTPGSKPLCIVAHTVKGKGVPAMEADPRAWHRRAPDPSMIAA